MELFPLDALVAGSNGNPPDILQHPVDNWDGWSPPDYDTVKAIINALPPAHVLERSERTVLTEGGEVDHHQLSHCGLKLKVWPSYVLVEGSLTKAIHGTNATRLDLSLIPELLEDMASFLEIPLQDVRDARVRRLDVGLNLPLQRSLREVTGAIGAPPRMEMARYGKASVAATNTRRQLAFYDKRLEQRKKKGLVDPRYGSAPLLRIEQRYLRDVDDQLGEEVTLGKLCDRDFHQRVGRRLQQAIFDLPLRRHIIHTGGVRGLVSGYAVRGIEAEGGLDVALRSVDAAHEAGTLTRHQATAMRTKLRTVVSDPALVEPSPVVEELLAAVRKVFDCSSTSSSSLN